MADVFDALTTTRPYKEAYSIEKTLDIMENQMEGHFDPRVMICFKAALPRCLEIYEKYRE
jgi:putative two-component system response regulator